METTLDTLLRSECITPYQLEQYIAACRKIEIAWIDESPEPALSPTEGWHHSSISIFSRNAVGVKHEDDQPDRQHERLAHDRARSTEHRRAGRARARWRHLRYAPASTGGDPR